MTVSSDSDLSVISCSPPLQSASTHLAKFFTWTLNDDRRLCYSMSSTFGSFLDELPRHLGRSAALDAAVRVMVLGYSSFRRQKNSQELVVANQYSNALLQLRNEIATFSGEGLPMIIAAVNLLAIFEVCSQNDYRVSLHRLTPFTRSLTAPSRLAGWRTPEGRLD